jgi:nitrate/TMAO reductase-like tetraheme cytochrome c subunit
VKHTVAFWKKDKEPKETRSEEKKARGIKGVIQKLRAIDWKNPINRWKLLFASLFAVIAMMGMMYGAIELTSVPSFCKSCHEMAPEHVTFEASAHSEIKCTQCHVEPGLGNELVHKVESLKEVYYHIVGPPDPIPQTVPVMNVNCEQCHSKNRLVTATGDLVVNHKGHIKEGIPCITCHAGVVHAKVVERGLNKSDDLAKWTPEVADKLISERYTRPNMGTCIDCHDLVNQGKKPWEDIAYSLPDVEVSHGGEKEHEDGEKEAKAADAHREVSKTKTQDIILQAIGQQKTDVKLSMECKTCHLEVSTPESHQNGVWNQNHGGDALTDLNECLDCHDDGKWIRTFAQEDIDQLLKGSTEKEKYTPNITVVKNDSRQKKFCSTCHANRPPGHVDSDTWLTSHAGEATNNQQKDNCYVCHDKTKPEENTTEIKAPTDVYCQFCHRTGFKDEKK